MFQLWQYKDYIAIFGKQVYHVFELCYVRLCTIMHNNVLCIIVVGYVALCYVMYLSMGGLASLNQVKSKYKL